MTSISKQAQHVLTMSNPTLDVRLVEKVGKGRWRVTFGEWQGQAFVALTVTLDARTQEEARRKAVAAAAARLCQYCKHAPCTCARYS